MPGDNAWSDVGTAVSGVFRNYGPETRTAAPTGKRRAVVGIEAAVYWPRLRPRLLCAINSKFDA